MIIIKVARSLTFKNRASYI